MQIKIYDAMVNGVSVKCVSGRELADACHEPHGRVGDVPAWIDRRMRQAGALRVIHYNERQVIMPKGSRCKRMYGWDIPLPLARKIAAYGRVSAPQGVLDQLTEEGPPKPLAPATLSNLVARLRALLADFEELCPQQLPLIK